MWRLNFSFEMTSKNGSGASDFGSGWKISAFLAEAFLILPGKLWL